MSEVKQYAERDAMALDEAGGYYMRHVMAMTGEQLHGKGDIAAELGWRDMQISALQQKLDAVLAENVALKDSVDHAAGCIHAAEVEGLIDALESQDGERLADLVHRRLCHAYLPVETPATDAILNEVRAEGVEMFAKESEGLRKLHFERGDREMAINADSRAMMASLFADQLRAGNVEEGV